MTEFLTTLLVLGRRRESGDIHVRQQVHGDSVARHPVERRELSAGPDGLRPAAGHVARGPGAVRVVRPCLGTHGLRAGREREGGVRHGGLRVGLPGVQRAERGDARDAGRVHAGRRRRRRLLRREPRGRLQPPDPGGARGRRHGRHDVRRGRVQCGPQRAVPRGAPHRGRRWLPQRVRRLRQARVPQRSACDAFGGRVQCRPPETPSAAGLQTK